MRPNVRPDADDPGLGGTVSSEVAAFRAALQDVLMDYGRAEWSCGHNHTKEDHPTGRCPRIDAALDEVWAALEAVPSEGQADAAAWREVAQRKIATIAAALNELGEPQPGYPAPVANAVAILRGEVLGSPQPAPQRTAATVVHDALHGMDASALHHAPDARAADETTCPGCGAPVRPATLEERHRYMGPRVFDATRVRGASPQPPKEQP